MLKFDITAICTENKQKSYWQIPNSRVHALPSVCTLGYTRLTHGRFEAETILLIMIMLRTLEGVNV